MLTAHPRRHPCLGRRLSHHAEKAHGSRENRIFLVSDHITHLKYGGPYLSFKGCFSILCWPVLGKKSGPVGRCSHLGLDSHTQSLLSSPTKFSFEGNDITSTDGAKIFSLHKNSGKEIS